MPDQVPAGLRDRARQRIVLSKALLLATHRDQPRSSTAQRLDGIDARLPTRANQPVRPVDPACSTPDTPLLPGLSSTERDRARPAAASAAQVCLWIRYRRPLASASQQQTAVRRRTRRHRQVLGLGHVHGSLPMRQPARDEFRLLEARDHPQPSPATATGLDLDREHPLQTLCPAHRDVLRHRGRPGSRLRPSLPPRGPPA